MYVSVKRNVSVNRNILHKINIVKVNSKKIELLDNPRYAALIALNPQLLTVEVKAVLFPAIACGCAGWNWGEHDLTPSSGTQSSGLSLFRP